MKTFGEIVYTVKGWPFFLIFQPKCLCVSFLSAFYAITIQSFQIKKCSKKVVCFCLGLWITMFCVSSTIGVNAGKLQSGSCLFYNFHVSERPFETIVNASFVCLNWIVILFSIYFSVKMIYHIRKISMAVRAGGTASDSSSQSKPYKKILLLILTNLLCWIPIQFQILSLCGFNVG